MELKLGFDNLSASVHWKWLTFNWSPGRSTRVLSFDETLRIKAFLVRKRNQTRDYLAETMGIERTAAVSSGMDEYYAEQNADGAAVSTQLVRQLAAVERGDVRDWRRIVCAVNLQPRGKVARELPEVVASVENPAMAVLFGKVLVQAVARSNAQERAVVVSDLQEELAMSGLKRGEFARELGTSQSRLSTYLSGKVVPSAATLTRAKNVAASHSGRLPA